MVLRRRLRTTSSTDIDAALTDQLLLGSALGDPNSWTTWLAVLRAAFGLPLDEQQQQLFGSVAGGRAPPTRRVRELWCILARRCGKSRMAAALGVYAACFTQHRLAAGEQGMVLVLAASQAQAKAVFNYVIGFLQASPVLRQEKQHAQRDPLAQWHRHRHPQQLVPPDPRPHPVSCRVR